MFEITNLSMPMAALLASLIGATATIAAALLNLRIAWRKELQARADHKPLNNKAKRGPVTAVITLMIASAIGGFLLAHYLTSDERNRTRELEQTLNTRIEQLDNVRQFGRDNLLQQLRLEEALRAGHEGIAAQISIDRCADATDQAGHPRECSEQSAVALRLCTELPAAATITGIELFARPEGELKSWEESRVVAGIDFGKGRFSATHSERVIDENHKLVCQGLAHWNSRSGLLTRMVVHYLPMPAATPHQPAKPG